LALCVLPANLMGIPQTEWILAMAEDSPLFQ
jgi:hypothetical protein